MNDAELNRAIIPALRAAKKAHTESWRDLLNEHRQHPGFRTTQDPVRRELGFVCNCTGIEVHQVIDIREIKEILPEARAAVQRTFQDASRKGMKAKRRKARKAMKRAEALLYRYLTREQKWSFRASKFFTVRAKDGKDYEIHGHWGNNVYRYDEDGKRRYRFCVVIDYKVPVPVFDLMLAQKLLLETNPRAFLDTAVVHDDIEGDWWPNGKHIDSDVEPAEPYKVRMARLREQLQEALNPADGDLERIEHLRAIDHLSKLALNDLLVPDVGLEERVHYTDIDDRGVAFVLNADLEVVPVFDHPCEVPKIDDVDHETRIIKLITGVPAATYKSLAAVQAHFNSCDLREKALLIHPETDDEWARSQDPIWHNRPFILGVRKIRDNRVPKGRAWYVADPETTGLHVQWLDSPNRGYCIFNLNGVAIYEPHADQEVRQREDHYIRARLVEIQEAQDQVREEAAARILQRQGGD